MKITIDWSYPTSPNAKRFKFPDGCWTVSYFNALHGTTVALLGFKERSEAEAFQGSVESAKYLCAVRKGREWIVTAWTTQGGCPAGAESVFAVNNITGATHWAGALLLQKNFGGFSSNAREVSATEKQLRQEFAVRVCRFRKAEDAERLCETFPDHAEEIRAVLALTMT